MLIPAMSTIEDTRGVLDLLANRRGNHAPIEVIHDATTDDGASPSPWCDHARDRLARALELPVSVLGIGNADMPTADPTWYCALRLHRRSPLLQDREWTAIAERVLRAAGLTGGADGDCPWLLIREDLDTVHLFSALAPVFGDRRNADTSRVLAECREIADVLDDVDEFAPPIPDETNTILIQRYRDDVVTLAAQSTNGIAPYMRDLGWNPGPRYGDTWYYTPFGARTDEIIQLVHEARRNLSSAGYTVRVDPALGLTRSARAQGRLTRPGQGSRRHAITPSDPGFARQPSTAAGRRRR